MQINKIEGIQTFVNDAVIDVDAISKNIQFSESIITSIAASIEEQSTVTTDISKSISTVLKSIRSGIDNINQV